jgi:molybdopterin converting factor subunit 1
MSVRVRLFAAFREIAGTAELELPANQAQTVGEVWGRLLARYPGLGDHVPSAAVNATYAALNDTLRDGDEVAFLPPVSGG